MLKGNRYVSHVIIPELPKEGYDQLFFYTITDKSFKNGKFYWGKGNCPINREYIKSMMDKGQIKKLNTKEYPFLLKDDQTLWIDENGDIFCASLNFPEINQKKIGNLEKQVKK